MSQWKWCAIDNNGEVIKGWYQDNDNWYYLNDKGVMQTGWIIHSDERWYYLDSNGALKTGWSQENGKWYYLDHNSNGYKGSMYVDGTYTIDEKSYAFDSHGVWIDNSCVSDNLFNFIKAFEGCYLEAYYCPSHVLTIGIGNTNPKWTSLGIITEEQAIEAFIEDMKVFADGVDSLASEMGITLNAYQREALISFSFNVGLGALESSTLWKNICNGITDADTITENFSRWNKGSDGDVLSGLVKRRACEAKLFLIGEYSNNMNN